MKAIVATIAFLIMLTTPSEATHLKAADITFKRISQDFFTYEFTVTLYTDVQSPVRAGDGIINFGDGVEAQLDINADSIEDSEFVGFNGQVLIYKIKITHTYIVPGTYTISYREPNRNNEIVNIDGGNSVLTGFYLQAFLVLDPSVGFNDSPLLNSFPIDRAFVGVKFTHNAWATDADGDSLSYRLVFPLQDRELPARHYLLPDHDDFYSDFNTGNEANGGPPSFLLDPVTGDLVWDAPGDYLSNSVGPFSEYTVAYIVEEWRKVNSEWMRIGYVTRDMQIIVSGEKGGRPDFELPDHAQIALGITIDQDIDFSNFQDEDIKVSFFGEPFQLQNDAMTATPDFPAFESAPVALNLQWSPGAQDLRDRPYLVHLKVESTGSDTEPPAVTYGTWVLSVEPLKTVVPPGISMPPTSTVVTGVIDLPEASFESFTFYPNPTGQWLFWKNNNDQREVFEEITIFNSLGKQTKRTKTASNTITGIVVAELPPGLYFISLKSKTARYRGTFIKN
ncbi:MAG: T9SS type A sorting domain-containing protein [Cyclobacteriaceae bacterium]|nr:T9SS type A sorting domain-containing protein [Cyclobacteriaceae bacterium]